MKIKNLFIFVVFIFLPALVIAEGQHCCVDGNSIITTVAGSGVYGYSGDGGPATMASFSYSKSGRTPLYWEASLSGLCVDSQDNLYICDGWNHVIRKVTTDGIISTWAGNGTPGFSGDGGPAGQAQLNKPTHIVQDRLGNFYICDEGNQRIRKVDTKGVITTVAGNGKIAYSGDGGPATLASFKYPYGLAVDKNEYIYITDSGNHAVRKVSPSGIITTIVGNGTAGSDGNGGRAKLAHVNSPECIAVDPFGNLYFNDDAAAFAVKPAGRLRKVDRKGIITAIAGTSEGFSSGDEGPATEAQIDDLHGIAFCGGNIYLSDVMGNRIRMIDPAGIIHTIAGDGMEQNFGDGGQAKVASVHFPDGLAIDSHGNLYFTEDPEHVVRKISVLCQPTPQKTAEKRAVPLPRPSPTVTAQVKIIPEPTNTPSLVPSLTPTYTPTVVKVLKVKKPLSISLTVTVTRIPTRKIRPTHTPTVEGDAAFNTVTPTITHVHRRHIRPTPTPQGEDAWTTPTLPPTVVLRKKIVTPVVKKKKRAYVTPTPTVVVTPRYYHLTPTPWVKPKWHRPSPTPTGILLERPIFPTFTLTPTVRLVRKLRPTVTFTPTPTPWSPLQAMNASMTITYTEAPANVYVTYEDGPGRYKLEVFDTQAHHLETVFDKKVIQQKDDWVDWDGKNDGGQMMPVGHYFAIFTKDDRILKKMAVIRVSGD